MTAPAGSSDPRAWVERGAVAVATGTIDFPRSRFVHADGRIERLTTREAEVLAFLVDHAGERVSRDELLGAVWGHHELSLSRAVDAAVSRLRAKIDPDPSAPKLLFTVHGHGYRILVRGGDAAPAPLPPETPPRRELRLGARTVDLSTGYVRGPGGSVLLNARERLMLEALLRARGAPVDAAKLIRVLGIVGGRSALSSAVSRLRAKIEAEPSEPAFLLAVRGEGYRLDTPPPTRAPLPRDEHAVALRSLAEHVGEVLGVPDCVVYRREGDVYRQVAAYGPKRDPEGGVIEPLSQRPGEGLVGHAVAASVPVCVADVTKDERYLADLVPARSELAVPIVTGGRVAGVIDSESREPSYFGERHVSGFLMLAAIAAPAFRTVVE